MRIVVLADVHANLPALEAALAQIEEAGYDLLVHLGDAIVIGPQPAECLKRLLALPRARMVLGNHDAYFAYGLLEPRPDWMNEGEVAHQRWTHAQLDPGLRAVVATWPDRIAGAFEGVALSFVHYALRGPRQLKAIIREPGIGDLDALFADCAGDIVCYGHDHRCADVCGRARYLNPGSLGCAPTAVARYSVLELRDGQAEVSHHVASYDDSLLYAAFEARMVPERTFLYRAFYGGRFPR